MDFTLFNRVELNVNPLLSAIRWFVSSPGNLATYTGSVHRTYSQVYIHIYNIKRGMTLYKNNKQRA